MGTRVSSELFVKMLKELTLERVKCHGWEVKCAQAWGSKYQGRVWQERPR